MKRLLIFLLLFSSLTLQAQKEVVGKHTLFVEFRGFYGFYSLNYDRILFVPKPFEISGRVGITLLPGADYNNHKTIEYTIPLMVNLLYGKYNHHLEVGGGVTYTVGYYKEYWGYINPPRDTVSRSAFIGFPVFIGYRYQKSDGGFMFRVGYYPSDDLISEDFGWLGLGLGYSF